MNKKISVIIPTYNNGKYLSEALESVLSQNIQFHEIIVIDDGSKDNTETIVKSFPMIRYHKQTNQGTAATVNTGVLKSTGEFLAFLDADDTWMPDKVAIQMQAFEMDPDLDMIFGWVQQFISPELNESERLEIDVDTKPMIGIYKSTWLIKKESFIKVGLFGGTYRLEEFIDWYMKAKEARLKELVLENVMAKRRIHTSNVSRLNKELRKDFPKVLKAALDRRRSNS